MINLREKKNFILRIEKESDGSRIQFIQLSTIYGTWELKKKQASYNIW